MLCAGVLINYKSKALAKTKYFDLFGGSRFGIASLCNKTIPSSKPWKPQSAGAASVAGAAVCSAALLVSQGRKARTLGRMLSQGDSSRRNDTNGVS